MGESSSSCTRLGVDGDTQVGAGQSFLKWQDCYKIAEGFCITSLYCVKNNIEQYGMSSLDDYNETFLSLIAVCRLVLVKWEEMIETRDYLDHRAPTVPFRKGRPQLSISGEELVYLSSIHTILNDWDFP